MGKSVEVLRHRIELYRVYLREGCSASQAMAYLRQIKEDEAALAAIAKHPAQQDTAQNGHQR